MATLSSPGIGSGLDITTLISKLMAVEQQPLVQLNQKEASYQAKISALGSLKGSLSSLQTAAEGLIPPTGTTAADKYTTTSASVADTTLATASATNSAAAGSYSLSDIVLAKAHQIRKSGLATPDEAGTLSITVGSGTAVSVNISASATLAQVRDAINASAAGATASLINNGTSDVLVLTAKNTGNANTITVDGSSVGAGFDIFDTPTPGGYILPADDNPTGNPFNDWVEQQDATDASLKINGIAVTSATNSISTAITGLTLTLVKEAVGPTTLTLSKNNDAVTSSLNTFIKAYNDTVKVMKDLGNYDATNKKASTLTGDATLRATQAQLRTVLFAPNGGSNVNLQRLSDLGVSVQQDGTLKLDSTKLAAAITSDFSNVASLVAAVGSRFKTAAAGLVSTEGSVTARIDGINSTVKSIGKRREAMILHLEKVQSNYRRQFNALDLQVANMQSLSARLQQQLASLPSFNNN